MITILNRNKITKPLPNQVYIGRGSIFGNPYTHLKLSNTKAKYQVSTRTEAIQRYREYMLEQYQTNSEYRSALDYLIEMNRNGQDINLVCYCSPKPCHGDILKEFIEEKSFDSLW